MSTTGPPHPGNRPVRSGSRPRPGREPSPGTGLRERLVLLSLAPKGGHVRGRDAVELGVAAAVLGELEWAGAVRPEEDGERIAAVETAQVPADPVQAEALAALRALDSPPLVASFIAEHGPKQAGAAVLERCVAAGVLSVRHTWLDRMSPEPSRYQVVDDSLLRDSRHQVEVAAQRHGNGPPEGERLAALIAAVGLERCLFPGWRGREPRRRLKDLAKQDWLAHAIRKQVRRRAREFQEEMLAMKL